MSGQDIAKKEADVAKIKDHLLTLVAGCGGTSIRRCFLVVDAFPSFRCFQASRFPVRFEEFGTGRYLFYSIVV